MVVSGAKVQYVFSWVEKNLARPTADPKSRLVVLECFCPRLVADMQIGGDLGQR